METEDNMKRKPVIAIDGYSSTGKSSISKEIAKRLGIIHMDTGALYRGITYYALQQCTHNNEIDLDCLIKNLNQVQLEFREVDNALKLYLNQENIDQQIRTQEVSDQVSFIAKQPEVRAYLLKTQQDIAENGGVIMDGRDIATVVLPNADYKFFLTASIEERSRRRYKELIELGMEMPIEKVRENLISRDQIDSEREVAPLRKADDAILIDNSEISKEETIALILSYIR